MATYTTNLNLKKPAGSENVSIGDINNNMDTIDSAVGTLSDQIATTTGSVTFPTGASGEVYVEKSGNIVTINGNMSSTSDILGANGVLITLPQGFRPSVVRSNRRVWATYGSNTGLWNVAVNTNGTITTQIGANVIPANSNIIFPSVVFAI